MKRTIGIIGFGKMGSAIAEQIKSEYSVVVFDKEKIKTEKVSGLKVAESLQDSANNTETIILAVKPQDFDAVLNEIKTYQKIADKLIISIAAGVTTTHIEKLLGNARVVRVMPNLPARIKQGMTCLCKGRFADEEDLRLAEELFGKVGKTLIIIEDLMDAATAVAGSGPGFFCDLVEGKSLEQIKDFSKQYFIPSLIATATNLAFTPAQAKILAETTGGGTVQYLIKEKITPAEVKKQVASKGGTTEAGLKELHHDIKNLEKAVKAALKKSRAIIQRGVN